MADYLLVMAHNRERLPTVVGVLVATGPAGSVFGEAAVGEGPADFRSIDAAIALLRSLADPGTASARSWLAGLTGVTNGVVTLTGPWEWEAQDREVLHWAMDEVGLTARTVVLIRESRVVPYPTDEDG